ncbi:MAG: chemotaxis protein CheW [Alphaproteobacteria bacterium]
MDDLVIEFLTETNESLDELDVDLVNFEQNPNDQDLLGKIFRLVHTIKGTCGFLDLPRLERIAHHAENVLGRFRDGDLEVTPACVTLIFDSIDRIKFIVSALEKDGKEPEGNDMDIIEKLDAAYEGKTLSDAGADAAPEATEDQSDAFFDQGAEAEAEPEEMPETKPEKILHVVEGPRELAPGDVPLDELEAAFAAAPGMEGIVNPADIEKQEEERKKLEAEIDTQSAGAGVQAGAAANGEEASAEGGSANKTTHTLRVNVDVLEDLMTMVSELVLTRNQLLQIVRAEGETAFSAPLQRLNHVVSELQEGVMKTRMQPIGNAWSKLPRIIRDLALELNKKIHLEMRGQDTELDRQVLEMIKDPLTHMIRNSGDHGIETPAERLKAGKQETGNIILEAYHGGGHIIIKISDDGKGLNDELIRQKALKSGLASAEELDDMSTQQLQQFIFKPGFSTAEKVTSVSGRGVGMDVVRTNIEKIGGSVDLKSTDGKGSVFTIKIPLTLAIVHALIVESAGERFAIPQLSVSELVMVSETGDNRIEYIKGAPVFRLRDRLLPLVSLGEVLSLAAEKLSDQLSATGQSPVSAAANPQAFSENNPFFDQEDGGVDAIGPEQEQSLVESLKRAGEKALKDGDEKSRNLYIVIAEVGGYQFGIIVDRVFDTEEIVVKPVAQMLKGLKLFSGNTILGDGRVIMILDPNGIANVSGSIDNLENQDAGLMEAKHFADSEKKTSLLLFNVGDNTPKAVPLSLVARLENVRMEDIEYSSGQMLVQYRGNLMPLVPFNSSISLEGVEDRPVLVFADRDQSMGIIVEEIVDIIEEHINVKLSSTQKGLMGSAIINEQATDVVDIAYFLNGVGGDWFKDGSDTPYADQCANGSRRKRVLLVDDSPFFRNMLTPVLSVAGYEVTTLEGPTEALKLQEDGISFDVIVSDIEMPDMDGFEFARVIRKSGGLWAETPMVALSSHATPKDIERGMEVGYGNYVAKFDKDSLLNTIANTLTGH